MSDPYPHPSSAAVTAVMKGNRSLDSKPEVALRSLLHRAGFRFRKHRAIRANDVTVKPDLVFVALRVAVFVDGCFWHNCPKHGRQPQVNEDYWGPKLERNRRRDERVNRALRAAGWRVVRIWEHDSAPVAMRKVVKALEDRT